MDEVIDALIAFHAVHDTRVRDILRLYLDRDFFLRLTPRRADDRFSAIQMPGRDAILSIGKAGIKSSDQQDLILTKEK
jgi:hypothetical protein